ncbi:GNAT family N-acetyltransferase [Actinomadura harenae]|nr:GNAT family protein [Actinomadura harenae]
MTLQGRLVQLEPLTPEMIGALLEAATEPEGTSPFTLIPQDPDAMGTYVSSALRDQEAGRALAFAIRLVEHDRIVGSTRFLDLDYWQGPLAWPPGANRGPVGDVPDVAEIGSTWLAPSARRTGANHEAKLLMLGHAFDTWNVHRVTLKTDARNSRSRAAITRLGAHFEGVRRAHVRAVDGTVRDTAYFSIVRAEWPEIRQRLQNRLSLTP